MFSYRQTSVRTGLGLFVFASLLATTACGAAAPSADEDVTGATAALTSEEPDQVGTGEPGTSDDGWAAQLCISHCQQTYNECVASAKARAQSTGDSTFKAFNGYSRTTASTYVSQLLIWMAEAAALDEALSRCRSAEQSCLSLCN